MIDKKIKSYIKKGLASYFTANGFTSDLKLEPDIYKKRFENIFYSESNLIELRYGKYYLCGTTFTVRNKEIGVIYYNVLTPFFSTNPLHHWFPCIALGYYSDIRKYFDYEDPIANYISPDTGNFSLFRAFSFEDADLFLRSLYQVNEKVIFPLFERIKTVQDVDQFYNVPILNGDEDFIGAVRNLPLSKKRKVEPKTEADTSNLWCALIAARLAKNPRYLELEEIINSWMPQPWGKETILKLNQYFEQHNL